MTKRGTKRLATAMLAVAGTIGAAAVAWAAHADTGEKAKRDMKVIVDNGGGDRVEIDDLGELEVGDSRSYVAESGKSVVVTRDEKGYELDFDGETMRIGDEPEAMAFAGARAHHMKRIELEDDEEGDHLRTKSFVISDDPDQNVVFFRGGPGAPGEHGFVFGDKVPAPPFMVEGILANLEQNEKFRSLDDATQDLVREALRESTSDAGLHWKERSGEPGESGTTVLIQKRRSAGEEEKANQEK